MKKNKNNIIIAVVVVFVIGLITGLIYYKDKSKFSAASKDFNSITEALNLKPLSRQVQQYCMYNNQKYSKGQLSCLTEVSLLVGSLPNSSELAKVTSEIGWISKGSNLDSWVGVDSSYIYAHLYTKNELTCSIREKKAESELTIEIDCSGPAKAEWFPVR